MGKFLVVCMFLMLAVVVSGRHLRYYDDLEAEEEKKIQTEEKAEEGEVNTIEGEMEKIENEEETDENEVSANLITSRDKQLWKAVTEILKAVARAEETGLEIEAEEKEKNKINVDGIVDEIEIPEDKKIIEEAIEEELKLGEAEAKQAEEEEAEAVSEEEEELVEEEPAESEEEEEEEVDEEKNALEEELEVQLEEGEEREAKAATYGKKILGMMKSDKDREIVEEVIAKGKEMAEGRKKKLEKLIAVGSMINPEHVGKFIDAFDKVDRPSIESFIQKQIKTAGVAEKEAAKEEKEEAEEESELKDQRRKRVRDVIKGAVRLFRKFLN